MATLNATFPPDVAHQEEFLQLEQEARATGAGLWAAATATAPTNTPPDATQPAATSEPAPVQPTATQPAATQPPAAAGNVVIVAVNKEAEYVDIRNDGSAAQDLDGWNLVSEKGNQDCPLHGVMLQPGQTLRIWALAEDAGQGSYNCGYGRNIWNNSEPDPAVLYDNSGNQVSRR